MKKTLEWSKIKGGFNGFEQLACDYVADQFPNQGEWRPTPKTRDGNRDAYTVILGFQPYLGSASQWWMEAKYSNKMDNLPRYRLDATIVSAMISGDVSRIIFVTNIAIHSKTMVDIRNAAKAIQCHDVIFCTKSTLEYWLLKNDDQLLKYFGKGIEIQMQPLFVVEDLQFYTEQNNKFMFKEPLHYLRKGETYWGYVSLFSDISRDVTIKVNPKINGLKIISESILSLQSGENTVSFKFHIHENHYYEKKSKKNISPAFVINHIDVISKQELLPQNAIERIKIKSQTDIIDNLIKTINDFVQFPRSECHLLYGQSGVGKSYLLNELINRMNFTNQLIFFVELTDSIYDNHLILLKMILFLLFPYLDPTEIEKNYFDKIKDRSCISNFLVKLLENIDDLDQYEAIIQQCAGRDKLLPLSMSINHRILVLDNIHKVKDSSAILLSIILKELFEKQAPVFVVLSGQKSEFTILPDLLEYIDIKKHEYRLTISDVTSYLRGRYIKSESIDDQTYTFLFPNLIELFLFAQYIQILGHEIDSLNDLIIAYRSFRNANYSTQHMISQFQDMFKADLETREICDRIYWSLNGLTVSDEHKNENIKKLMNANLIKCDQERKLVPWHELYKIQYRKHFSKVQTRQDDYFDNPLEAQRFMLLREFDCDELKSEIVKIEQLYADKKFNSLFYILEDIFESKEHNELKNQWGEANFYRLYFAYSLSVTNLSKQTSGKSLFQKIHDETYAHSNLDILEICAKATWELINSLYESLNFDESIKYTEKLYHIIKILQAHGMMDSDHNKIWLWHNINIIRCLISSERGDACCEQLYNQTIYDLSANGFTYRCLTFQVRYAQTLLMRDTKRAQSIFLACLEQLEQECGFSEKFVLWAGMHFYYTKLIDQESPEDLNQMLSYQNKLMEHFFNDYRKSTFAIAAYYYSKDLKSLGNKYFVTDANIKRELRPRQQAFYYETIALFEYISNSYQNALRALEHAKKLFANNDSYLVIIKHNMELLSKESYSAKRIEFCRDGILEKNTYYIDPRCIW